MKKYIGYRTLSGTALVMVHEEGLKPYNFSITRSQQIWNHSPTGFEWGYGGSGPAQLALALLLDVTDNPPIANYFHQDYKREVIAGLAKDAWTITDEEVRSWLRKAQENETKLEEAKKAEAGKVKG